MSGKFLERVCYFVGWFKYEWETTRNAFDDVWDFKKLWKHIGKTGKIFEGTLISCFVTFEEIEEPLKPVTDDSRDIREMRKTCKTRETYEKKMCAWDNVKINYTRFPIWLFLSYNYFIPYCTRKSLCLMHNYCFYHGTVWDTRHEKSVSWNSLTNTK